MTPDDLAHALSTFGFGPNEHHVEHFARRLMAAGEVPHLTGIMLDRDAAPIARERAFARAAVAIHTRPRQVTFAA